MQKKKTYLELYLDSTADRKRGIYFGEAHEEAIVRFNILETPTEEKNHLFFNLIEPGFKRIISGVLEMPKFHNLGRLNREDLIDSTYFRLVEKLNRFTPGRIGKNGQPVKAYSYFSTVAKNYILEIKVKHEKIIKHKADVESSIDLSILSEDTLQMMSNYDSNNILFEENITTFQEVKLKILKQVSEVISKEEASDKPDQDLIKIGYYLRYIIEKWDKIEFMKKNEFMRILTLYTGLKQQQVSLLFKKFKLAVLEEINPRLLNKKYNSPKIKEDKDELEDEFIIEEKEIEIDDEVELTEEEILKRSNDLIKEEQLEEKYKYFTLEDYESYMEKEENKINKPKWRKIKY